MDLDRLRHVDFFVAQHLLTHHAVLELARDDICGVEETRQTVDQSSVSGRVHGSVTRRHGGGVLVQLLLGLQQHQCGGRGNAGSTDRVTHQTVSVGNVSVHGRGQLADTWLQDTLCEVVQLHGQFSGCEVDTDVLLAGDSQSGELFVVVLNLQGGTVSDQSAVGQTDTQCRTDLGTFNSEAVVVLAVHVAGDHQVVLEDFERLAGDHVNG